jgi:putative transposase
LGYAKGEAPKHEEGQRRENHRNGSSKKTLISEEGKLEIEVARDRTGEFEPQFIRKGQKRFGGFDTKIIAMYAQGMTVREIKRFLEEQYKVEISTELISTVTDSVLEDVIEWQNRPLEPMYPVVFFDALKSQNPRRRNGQKQSGVPGVGHPKGWDQGCAGDLDPAE